MKKKFLILYVQYIWSYHLLICGLHLLWDTCLNVPTPLDLYYNTGHLWRKLYWPYMFSKYEVPTSKFGASVFYETLVQKYPLCLPSILTLVTLDRINHTFWNITITLSKNILQKMLCLSVTYFSYYWGSWGWAETSFGFCLSSAKYS